MSGPSLIFHRSNGFSISSCQEHRERMFLEIVEFVLQPGLS